VCSSDLILVAIISFIFFIDFIVRDILAEYMFARNNILYDLLKITSNFDDRNSLIKEIGDNKNKAREIKNKIIVIKIYKWVSHKIKQLF
jgi:hypothetical protein